MHNRPYRFEIYLVNVKTMRTTEQIFVDFSETLNFTVFIRTFPSKVKWTVAYVQF